ncbi:MAG: hypothetical protein VZQ48_01430 [Candidatus Cryptobacteroides sp.]|nr:hypothetical protein [Candidatus Cryptobacteroides sp.]
MRARTFILFATLCLAALSCQREKYAGPDPELGITIEFPATPALKGEIGDVAASTVENTIRDFKIWVFTSDESHERVTSMVIGSGDYPPAGGARRYALKVSHSFASEMPNVDVFILANSASVGLEGLKAASSWDDIQDPDKVSSWSEVRNALIEQEYFGLQNPVHSVSASTGLPLSGAAFNQVLRGEGAALGVRNLSLTRAVSKMRFLFSQMALEGAPEDMAQIKINKVVLKKNQIPVKEYVFSDGTFYQTYEPVAFEFDGPGTNVASSSAPERYVWVNQSATQYEALLDDGVTLGELTDCGVTYFRESGKKLEGEIQYQVTKSGVTTNKTKPFSMAAEGDFARNHIWTVYGYFIRDLSLHISVGALPWDKQTYNVDFSEAAIVAEPKFWVDNTTADEVRYNDQDGYMDVYIPTNSPVIAYIPIKSPVGGHLFIRPEGDTDAFAIDPYPMATIDPDNPIALHIGRNNEIEGAHGKIIFRFVVEAGGREMDADSELIDTRYRFVIP